MGKISRHTSRAAGVAALTAGVLVPLTLGAAPAQAGTLTISTTTKLVATMRGNGHGHGMSQYGARGAGMAGKSSTAILAFYYPKTTLTKLSASRIRVRISGTGSTTTVAARTGTTVTGSSRVLPTSGVAKYRLVANSGSGLTLQQLKKAKGSSWKTYRTGLKNGASFHRSQTTRVYTSSGSTSYHGFVRAIRNRASGSSGGVYTVNNVTLDSYTSGVVPREMPASWNLHAVKAQAVAARSYGRYAVEHPSNAHYDICDTTSCQVYGGHARYDSSSRLLYQDYAKAATTTANKVLRYKGKTIFAQFSASNGGYMISGGQPYLVTKADPYDNAKSGDPYFRYKRTVSVKSMASWYGLKKITKLIVTKRDGHGEFGGRVVSGYVEGLNSAGHTKRIATTGAGFQASMGAGTSWFWWSRA